MPLHVSSTVVLVIRRSKLYYTASGIFKLCRWPSGAQVGRGLKQNKNVCIKLVNYEDYTEMHGQQNIKKLVIFNQTRCSRLLPEDGYIF